MCDRPPGHRHQHDPAAPQGSADLPLPARSGQRDPDLARKLGLGLGDARARFQEKLRPGIPRRRDMCAPMGMSIAYTFPGAIMATVAVYLPFFLFVGVLALVLSRLRKSPGMGAFPDAIESRPSGFTTCLDPLRTWDQLPGHQG